jgi:hypothetical protein
MALILIPAFAWLYGTGEVAKERQAQIERINSQPVEIALPRELPRRKTAQTASTNQQQPQNIWDF